MKGLLNNVLDLQAKYVDLTEYKKHSCLNIDKIVPEIKVSEEEEEEGLSDAKIEQVKINRRKRRRYKNSFINQLNLVQLCDQDFIGQTLQFQGTTLQYFEQKEKQFYQSALTNMIKPDPPISYF
jgi:hypothetical protein